MKDKEHSGSWKNQYLETFSDIYTETTFACPEHVLKPQYGLRLGEVRGIRAGQFIRNEKMLIVDGFCRNYNVRTNYNKKGSDENRKIRVVPVPEKVFSQLVGSLKDTKTYVNYVFD